MADFKEQLTHQEQESTSFIEKNANNVRRLIPVISDPEEDGDVLHNKGQAEMTERQILKNILVISLSCTALFGSFGGLSSLQSSLHIQEGIGVITQSILYGTMAATCLFLPKPVIYYLGHKWTLILSMIGYILWMAANGYAVWGTMITACVLVGICAGTLWTSQSAYVTIVAGKYAVMRDESLAAVNARFFGIFFALSSLNGIVNAAVQTTLLWKGRPENYTGPSVEDIQLCGLNDCPWANMTNNNFEKPTSTVIWTLVAIYIGISVLGVIMAAILTDKIPDAWLPDQENKTQSMPWTRPFQLLGASIRHLRHINQLLLIPLTLYSGLQHTFYHSEFNKSYITCNLGMGMISLLTLPGAVVYAIVAVASGYLVKRIGSLPIFVAAMLVDVSLQLILLLWTPGPDQVFTLILIPVLHRAADSVWQTQTNALYGTLFPKDPEAAFANYRLWRSLGFILSFAWSAYLCTSVKLYLTMAVFYLGSCLLFVVYAREHIHMRNNKQTINVAD